MTTFIHSQLRRCKSIAAMLMILLGIMLSSCSAVFDDLEDCRRGVIMRFMFDYNLEFADAFASQVDCISVFIFDSEGNLVEQREENSGLLAQEGYRMEFDLEPGDYHAIVYGGLHTERSSFIPTKGPLDLTRMQDLEVTIDESHLGDEQHRPAAPLHDLFHGALDFKVTAGLTYDRVTVKMMRNTNHLRIVLQNINNKPVDSSDFHFEVTDDNIRFNHANDVLPYRVVNYRPWSKGNAVAGLGAYTGSRSDDSIEELTSDSRADIGMPVQVGFAEISMSRLMYKSSYTWTRGDGVTGHGPRLRISNEKTGRTIADLPLINYLLLMKSDQFGKMDNQEYLDRAYRHNLVFFLDSDNNTWLGMQIIVGDWTVRIDNPEF